jgi:hypothetical protein
MSEYTRESPSPEYRAMVEMYSRLHSEGADKEQKNSEESVHREPEETFAGKMLARHAPTIKEMIDRTAASTLLDYGAGKGASYRQKDLSIAGTVVPTLQEYWGLDEVVCYDPGYAPFSQLPNREFDVVISTDVLEHITEPDLPWVLDELFGYARKSVFATIACYPARKTLPDGRNAHCTVRSPDWWSGMIHAVAMRHTEISYRFSLGTRTGPRKKGMGLWGRRKIEDHTIERWA